MRNWWCQFYWEVSIRLYALKKMTILCNRMEFLVSLTLFCSTQCCSHDLQANSSCFVLNVDMLIISKILLVASVFQKQPPPPLFLPLTLKKKKAQLFSFLQCIWGSARAPIFLVGGFSINNSSFTPNSDILSFELLKCWAHGLGTGNTTQILCV